MDTLSKYSPDKNSFFKKDEHGYFFVALVSGLIFFIATYPYGLGITNDSVNYVHAAHTVLEGMQKADGTIYTEWPPLYPLILSIANFIAIDTLLFAQLLHGLIYILTFLIMLTILKINIRSKPVYIVSVILLIFSAPILQMHVMLWSESIFLLFVLINCILLKSYAEKSTIKNLLLLVLMGALMYLQRKTGTIFIVSTSLLILYLHKFKKRGIFHSSFYLLCCSIPVYLWYKRRYEISGKVFGASGLELGKFTTNAEQFLNTFTSYLMPSFIPLSLRIIVLLFSIAFIVLFFLKNKKLQILLQENIFLKISFFNVLFYYSCLLVFLIYIQIDDSIDDRILSPVLLPLYLFLVIIMDAIYIQLKVFRKEYAMLFLIPISMWAFYSSARTVYHIHRWNTSGTGGYNSLHWSQNKLVTYFAQSGSVEDTLYTNNIYPLNYFLNLKMKNTFVILPEERITSIQAKGTLVCFEKKWTYPAKECIANTIDKKEILINNQDGVIWALNK